MCGIVGHIGPKNAVESVLQGLKRLEYRGYDSAGVSFKTADGKLKLFKKSGKLQNLKNLLVGENYSSHSCVGHTRWATHGEVSDSNSHPHLNGKISIVHNGIIENAKELKIELIREGVKFYSETDSEVFLGLLVYETNQGRSILQAICNSFKKIRGNSAFVIQSSDTDEIYAVKRGAPLVCGTHQSTHEALVSSDPYALVGAVDELFFPEDDVICVLKCAQESKILFYNLAGERTDKYLMSPQEMSLEEADKGEFEHFMLKEIYEQPALIRSFIQFYFGGPGASSIARVRGEKPHRVHISACGTAFYAGLMIRDYFEHITQVPSYGELASEFRYRNPLLLKNDLGLFISQSGETADTLAAQALCKAKGVKTFSLVNVQGSTLYRDCDENLLIRAGVEIGVASTKAFTQQVLTGRILATVMAGGDLDEGLAAKLNLLADRMAELIQNVEVIKSIAEKIYNYNGFFFTGRGIYYPVALEGALKLKEIAYVHAEGYAAGELKHGPIALIDENMVNIAIIGPELYEKTISNVEEIKARRGKIVLIGPDNLEISDLGDYHIPMNYDGLEELAPLYANVANQLLAYYMAKFKGTDIDRPRNLAKSVTVE